MKQNKFEQLQNFDSMLCLSCKEYYSIIENTYLSSKYFNKDKNQTKDNDFYKKYILSKQNFDIFPTISIKIISSILNNLISANLKDIGVSSHGEYVFNTINLLEII